MNKVFKQLASIRNLSSTINFCVSSLIGVFERDIFSIRSASQATEHTLTNDLQPILDSFQKRNYLRVGEAADFLHVSPDTLRNWESSGYLVSKRSKGGDRRYKLADLEEVLLSRNPALAAIIKSRTSQLVLDKGADTTIAVPELPKTSKGFSPWLPKATTLSRLSFGLGSLLFLGSVAVGLGLVANQSFPNETKRLITLISPQSVSSPAPQRISLVSRNIIRSEEAQEGWNNPDPGKSLSGDVLAASDTNAAFSLEINAPTNVNGSLSVNGEPVLTNAVTTFQGKTGALSLESGTGIKVSGLLISNIATLADVVTNGGCSDCVTNSMVKDDLTISSSGSVSPSALSATVPISKGGTGLTGYTAGDIQYASATDTLSKLGVGSSGQVLTVSGGVPKWSDSSGGVSSLNSLTGALTIAGGGINAVSASGSTITITATEADTLSSVTGRGATTTTTVALNGGLTSSSATPITFSSTTPAIAIGGGGTLTITDGSNTLLSLADSGSNGTLTVNAATVSGLSTGVVINSSGVLSSEATLATSRGGLGASVSAAGAGEIPYSTSTTAYGHLAAGTATYVLVANGAAAPVWTAQSGLTGVGTAFSSITSGTNTGAAMFVGTGASLAYTGNGVVDASLLLGATWVSPGTIGSTSATTGKFTTLNATTAFQIDGTQIIDSARAFTNVVTINSNTFTSTALTFAGSPTISTSVSLGDVSINTGIGSTSTGQAQIHLAGGSSSTGCTIDDFDGSFVCSGGIVSGGGGSVGYWGTDGGSPPTLSPATTGSHITTSGNISATGSGTITSGGLLTASNGLTLTTGALSLTATSGSVAATLTSSATAFNINSGLFNIDTTNSFVGVGTTSPGSKLGVAGGLGVGISYSTLAAPTNGLIVQGSVGIGTTTAGSTFNVNGNTVIGFGLGSVAAPTNGLAVSGSVGIGHTSPGQTLSIAGNVGIGFSYSRFATGPTNGLMVQGNVGIGTTNPTAGLHVVGTSIFTGNMTQTSGTLTITGGASPDITTNTAVSLTLKPATISTTATGLSLNLYAGNADDGQGGAVNIQGGTGSTTSGVINLGLSNTSSISMGAATDIFGNLSFSSTNPTITTSTTNRLGLTANSATLSIGGVSGNIGVGTTSPGSALGINGGVGIGISYSIAAAPTNGLAVQGSVGIGVSSPSNTLAIAGSVGIGYSFARAAGPSNGLAIEGNVGIGTTTPSQLLHVVGSTTNTSAFLFATNSDNTNAIGLGSGRSGDNIARLMFENSSTRLDIATVSNITSPTLDTTIMTLNPAGQVTIPTTGTSAGLVLGTTNTVTLQDDPTVAERAGTARRTYTINLVPEFEGAVMTPDGSSNSGSMVSDFCSEDGLRNINSATTPTGTAPCDNDVANEEHNYYSWTSTSATQDYDIWVRFQLPTDFSAWAASNPIKAYGWRTDAGNSVQVSVFDTGGTVRANAVEVATGTVAWTQTNVATDAMSAGTWTAGSFVTIKAKLANDTANDYVMVGEITLDYLSKFK